MNRRSFLGSMIGLWAGASFFARTIKDPPQIVEPSLEDYQMLFRDSLSGYTVRAPGVKDLESRYERWKFVAHDLHVTRTMRLDQILLCDRNGRLLRPPRYIDSGAVHLINGDTFTVTFVSTLTGSGTDDFEKALAMTKELGIDG